MADEPLALSTTPPAVPADDDDAMCAALRQTEGGRRFLEEHVRRQRASDPDSLTGAIEPVDAVEEEAQPAQLDILAAVERLQDLAWIMREHGLETATCEHIEALTSTILAAPSLCDPADRRAQKLAPALGHLERHIDSMIVAARGRAKERLPKRTELPFAVPAPHDGGTGTAFRDRSRRARGRTGDRSKRRGATGGNRARMPVPHIGARKTSLPAHAVANACTAGRPGTSSHGFPVRTDAPCTTGQRIAAAGTGRRGKFASGGTVTGSTSCSPRRASPCFRPRLARRQRSAPRHPRLCRRRSERRAAIPWLR